MRRFALFVAVVGAAFASSIQAAGATSRIAATPKLSVSGKPAVAGSATTLRLEVVLAHGDRVAKYSLKYGDVSHLVTGKNVPGTLRHVFGRPGKYTATLTVTDVHHRATHTSLRFTVPPRKNAVVTPPVPIPRAPLVLPDGYQQTGELSAGPVVAADVDGNGTIDLVRTTSSGTMVELGDGHGHFKALPNAPMLAGVNSEVADMNGDGIPDLVLTDSHPPLLFDLNVPTGGTTIHLGDGKGNFVASPTDGLGPMFYNGWAEPPLLLDLGDLGPDLVEDGEIFPTDGHGDFLRNRQLTGVQPVGGLTVGPGLNHLVRVDYVPAMGYEADVYKGGPDGSVEMSSVALPGSADVDAVTDLGDDRAGIVTSITGGQVLSTVDLAGSSPTLTSTVPLPDDFVGDPATGAPLDLNGDDRTDVVSGAGSIAFGTADGYVSGGRMPEGVELATSQFLLLDGPSGYDVVAR